MIGPLGDVITPGGEPYAHCTCKGGFGPPPVSLGCAGDPDCVGCRCGGGRAMGDDDLETSQVRTLQLELNRFTRPMRGQTKPILAKPVPVTGNLDLLTAMVTMSILQVRAVSALLAIPDAATTQIVTDALSHLNDAQAYVGSHLGDVMSIVHAFADASGLPTAARGGMFGGGGSMATAAVVGGGLLLGLVLLGRKRRSR